MPIYDYHCDHCGHTFSAVQSYTDATLDTCPSCGKRPRKLMATPAIVFKGGGWYKTDSRPASKESGEAKADAKPDADARAGSDKLGPKDKPKDAGPATAATPTADKPAPPLPKGGAASS
ncbi:MAG TPA: FmdB family zinc ribbon protein [Candidatus Limnocylindria bacterium]|nr:FmdB family zinc ribbon protein [Candidatus Limnocylindria bacterium]